MTHVVVNLFVLVMELLGNCGLLLGLGGSWSSNRGGNWGSSRGLLWLGGRGLLRLSSLCLFNGLPDGLRSLMSALVLRDFVVVNLMRALTVGYLVVDSLLMSVNFAHTVLLKGLEMEVSVSEITHEWLLIELVVLSSTGITVDDWVVVGLVVSTFVSGNIVMIMLVVGSLSFME